MSHPLRLMILVMAAIALGACGAPGVTSNPTSSATAGGASGGSGGGQSGSTSGAGTSSSTGGSGGSSGASGTSGTTGQTTAGHAPPYRVLFDAAHKQVAGQADWIVDSNMPDPQPSNPTSETAWSGGISSWGYDLYASGRYVIEQLPPGSQLSYGQGGSGDLANFDVFVSDEPELHFGSGEQAALMQLAQAGGGIFLISDHAGAIRCSSCTEAWRVINDFLSNGAGGAFGVQCDGNDVGSSGLLGSATGAPLATSFTNGPFGTGTQLSYHSGSTISITGQNAAAAIVVNSSSGGMMAATTLSSGGRLVLVGDSSPEEDGSCACSATLHNGWGEAGDAALILNATAWLAHDGS